MSDALLWKAGGMLQTRGLTQNAESLGSAVGGSTVGGSHLGAGVSLPTMPSSASVMAGLAAPSPHRGRSPLHLGFSPMMSSQVTPGASLPQAGSLRPLSSSARQGSGSARRNSTPARLTTSTILGGGGGPRQATPKQGSQSPGWQVYRTTPMDPNRPPQSWEESLRWSGGDPALTAPPGGPRPA